MTKEEILKKYPKQRRYLISALHELQDNNPENYLTEKALSVTAEWFNITLSAVAGAAHYYSMFSTLPRSENILRICASPVCRNAGSGKIVKACSGSLREKYHLHVEKCECLGHCQDAPAAMINATTLGNLDENTLDEILNASIKDQSP